MRRFSLVLSALLAVAIARSAPAAIVADPAYVVGTIPLPIVNAADVAVVGASIAIGQGSFGAGGQSIIRLDPNGGVFTIVSNLNAIGAIVYDAANDRLLFTDNAGELPGATNGDTIYALADPRSVVSPIDAATLTLLPSGSIPAAQAVLPLPGGDVLVGDAAGPGSGRVVRISSGVPSDLVTGLDYTSGVSLSLSGGELLIGNVDAFFSGNVIRYSLAGVAIAPLATGLSGSYDQAVDADGDLLLTGGFTGDFSSSTVIAIAPNGAVDEIASGFGFSSGLTIDGPSRQVMVLDFGTTRIDTLTPVDALTPGGGGSKECHVETFGGAPVRSSSGKPKNRWECTDGDPACDRDGVANGACVFWVGACLAIADARAPKCAPVGIDAVTVTSKRLATAAAAIASAVSAALPAAGPTCSGTTIVPVTADGKGRTIVFDASWAGKRRDKDVLSLRCRP
ncbi:MAG: hypothetical protein IT293_07875 [Deltaproteobacteria bacterium]|nr:hypothetical protein [Deltaproteobacteria bacterium]